MINAAAQIWKSWMGLALASLHAVTLTALIWAKEPLPPPQPCPPDIHCFDLWGMNLAGVTIIAGRSFHLAYETPVLQFLLIADLPSMLVEAVVVAVLWLPLQTIDLSKQTASYLVGFGWLIFGSLQWWLIGWLLETKLKSRLQLKRHLT